MKLSASSWLLIERILFPRVEWINGETAAQTRSVPLSHRGALGLATKFMAGRRREIHAEVPRRCRGIYGFAAGALLSCGRWAIGQDFVPAGSGMRCGGCCWPEYGMSDSWRLQASGIGWTTPRVSISSGVESREAWVCVGLNALAKTRTLVVGKTSGRLSPRFGFL